MKYWEQPGIPPRESCNLFQNSLSRDPLKGFFFFWFELPSPLPPLILASSLLVFQTASTELPVTIHGKAMFSLQVIAILKAWNVLYFLNSVRPKKTQVANHGVSAESLGMFPYHSSDGTSSAVSRFYYTLKFTYFSLLH